MGNKKRHAYQNEICLGHLFIYLSVQSGQTVELAMNSDCPFQQNSFISYHFTISDVLC